MIADFFLFAALILVAIVIVDNIREIEKLSKENSELKEMTTIQANTMLDVLQELKELEKDMGGNNDGF